MKYDGGYPDIAKDALKLLKPHLKSTENLEEYLEDYYGYTPSEIKKSKEKSKKLTYDVGKKNAYLYYLLSDIIDNNQYDNVYELLYDASIDASVLEDDNSIKKLSRKYTKKEEMSFKKMFKKMGLDFTAAEFNKFIKKNKYFTKKGNKIIPDTIGLMAQAWNYFSQFAPKVIPVAPKVIPIDRRIIIDRRIDDYDNELLRRDLRAQQLREQQLREQYLKDLEKYKHILQENENIKKEYNRAELDLKKQLFKQHLQQDEVLEEKWKELARERNPMAQQMFDEWNGAPVEGGADVVDELTVIDEIYNLY